MRLIEMHPIWQKKQFAFTELRSYLQESLRPMRLVGGIAYGSVMRANSLHPHLSDIDVIAYSDCMSRETAQEYIHLISSTNTTFFDKSPIFIEDHVTARIEFSVLLDGTVFDVSIFPSELSGYKKRYTNTIHDRLEVAIGSMYQEAYLLFGEVPFERLIQNEFIPFYADELRTVRMQQLEDRLHLNLNKLESAINQGEDDLLCQIYKTRSYLIKWVFINERTYPVDCNRYLRQQLSQRIHLSKKVIDSLLLEGESVDQAQRSFLRVARDLLSNTKP